MFVFVWVAHADLLSPALLRLFSLLLPPPQLGFGLLQLPLRDFPECLDLFPLQLEALPLLALSVQLPSEPDDVVRQLQVQKQV